MKRAYTSHQYSGRRVNPKRSRAAFHRHSGNAINRAEAWRDKPAEQIGQNNEAPLQKDSEQEMLPKTYEAVERNEIALHNTEPQSVEKNEAEKKQDKIPKTYPAVHRNETAMPKAKPKSIKKQPCKIIWPTDPEVERHKLSIEREPKQCTLGLESLNGYRIVDIKHVFTWLLKLQSDHSKVCTLGQVKFQEENKDGLSSVYTFRCDMCEKTWHECSEQDKKINKSFVWGSLTAASHFSQASHLLAIMDIPAMSADKFKKLEMKLGKIWDEHLWAEMTEAAAREKEIAIEKGHICADGVPYVTVYVDGGWCKRSYGHNFNASSGIACIIGVETKKCLFLGIRNKYCNICTYNEKKGVEKEHNCFRNYKGSSTGMEADILVEGFSKSVEMYGLRYTSFVGDGDSSVFARLKAKVPYGNIIKKEECKNHVTKNYTGALFKIAADTKLPIEDRKLLKERIKKLTTVARLNMRENNNAEKMRKDLKNGPLHVFGEHTNCESYYCRYKSAEETQKTINEDTNFVPQLKQTVLMWALIETAIDNVARKADRLLQHLTNNVAENFMSLVAKYNCGKRINFSRSGSYHRRAQLAGLCQISGQQWQAKSWKSAVNKSPGINFKKYLAQKANSARLRKSLSRKRVFKPVQLNQTDKDYGPKADDVPMEVTEEELKNLCDQKLQELQIQSLEEINKIQQETTGQHGNTLYDHLRKDRLTASQFGMICKRRSSTPCHNHVKSILYKNGFSNEDTKYGQNFEKVALKLFETEMDKTVVPSGLFIDPEYGFLGASPDGLVVGEDALVEVKCFPSLVRSGRSIEEAAKEKKNFPLALGTDGGLSVNKKHNFYYQIQGQLRVARRKTCYLIIFTEIHAPIKIITVIKDDEFIQDMVGKLVLFYKSAVLPEIILRRVPANQKCKEPNLDANK